MKHFISYLLMVTLSMGMLMAQPHSSKFKEIKKTFFTEKLQLTTVESEQFWKIYDQYETEGMQLKKSLKESKSKKYSEMNDQEIYQFVDHALIIKEKKVQLQKTYFKQFKKVLPAQKYLKLLRIEEQFRQYLLKQMRNKKK